MSGEPGPALRPESNRELRQERTKRSSYVCTPRFPGWRLLRADIVRRISFLTDEFNQFGVGVDALIQFDGPGLRVRLRIVDRDLDFKVAVVRTPEPLGDFAGRSQRATANIQPDVVNETGCFDDQSVPFPLSYRVAVPPGFGILARQGPSIREISDAGRCWPRK